MSKIVLLDAGPLGLVTNPKRSPQSIACAQWLQSLITAGAHIILPEIADYEVRRELLRANKTQGVARLDGLAKVVGISASHDPCNAPSSLVLGTSATAGTADSRG